VGHLTELVALPPPEQDDIIRGIAEAGIGLIGLPATDLYLTGRRDPVNPRRGLTPIRRLLAANNVPLSDARPCSASASPVFACYAPTATPWGHRRRRGPPTIRGGPRLTAGRPRE
jgi:hypothetical protein